MLQKQYDLLKQQSDAAAKKATTDKHAELDSLKKVNTLTLENEKQRHVKEIKDLNDAHKVEIDKINKAHDNEKATHNVKLAVKDNEHKNEIKKV